MSEVILEEESRETINSEELFSVIYDQMYQDTSEAESEEESKPEMSSEVTGVYQVNYEHGYDESGEYAVIAVCDAEGEIWRYENSTEEVAQIDCFSMLGETATSVYFLDNGVVKSFDIATGALQWELAEHRMSTGASLVDEDGTLYVCGYFGSFFMVVSPEGEVLALCAEAAQEDLYWPYAMEFVGDKVRIYCESNEDAIVLLNKEDYSYTVE